MTGTALEFFPDLSTLNRVIPLREESYVIPADMSLSTFNKIEKVEYVTHTGLYSGGFQISEMRSVGGWELDLTSLTRFLAKPRKLFCEGNIVELLKGWYAIHDHLYGSSGCGLCNGTGRVAALFMGGDKLCPNQECKVP